MADLNAADLEGAMKIIEGTARSMGVVRSRVRSVARTSLSEEKVPRGSRETSMGKKMKAALEKVEPRVYALRDAVDVGEECGICQI